MCIRDRCAVAVALQQPLAVVGDGELSDGGPELLEGVEALDPEHLLLECLDELLRAAVGLGLVVVGRAAGDPEVIDLDLVVLGPEARRLWGAKTRSCVGGRRFGALRARSVAGSIDDGRS